MAFPLFLVRQCLTIWVSLYLRFFLLSCAEHTSGLFQFQTYFRSFVLYRGVSHPVSLVFLSNYASSANLLLSRSYR
jgi:hypothetical protein